MSDEAPSSNWLNIPKAVTVATSPSNEFIEAPEENKVASNTPVLGLECFSWTRARDGLPTKQPVPDFLYQLTRMLLDGPKEIIEWQHGKIIIHNPMLMESDLLKRYFRHSNFMSFKRQLNYFGFRKLSGSKGKLGPCIYINYDVGPDVKKLLTIKRRNSLSSMKSQEQSLTRVKSLRTEKQEDFPEGIRDIDQKWPNAVSGEKTNELSSENIIGATNLRRVCSAPGGDMGPVKISLNSCTGPPLNFSTNCAFAHGSSEASSSIKSDSTRHIACLSSDNTMSDLTDSRKSSEASCIGLKPSLSWIDHQRLMQNLLWEIQHQPEIVHPSSCIIPQLSQQESNCAEALSSDKASVTASIPMPSANFGAKFATSALQGSFDENHASSTSFLPNDLVKNFEAAIRNTYINAPLKKTEVEAHGNCNDSCKETHFSTNFGVAYATPALQGSFDENHASSSSVLQNDLVKNFEAAIRKTCINAPLKKAEVEAHSSYNDSCKETRFELPADLLAKNFCTFPSDSDMLNLFHPNLGCSTTTEGISRESSLERLARIPSRYDVSAGNSYVSMHSFSSASLHLFDDE